MMSQKDYERDDARSECCRMSFLQRQRGLRPLYANVGRTRVPQKGNNFSSNSLITSRKLFTFPDL